MISGNNPSVEILVGLDARINYAMQQNDVPVIKSLQIKNLTGEPIRDIKVRVHADPEFASDWISNIALIDAKATYNVTSVDLTLSPRFLSELTERVAGVLWFEVSSGEKAILKTSYSVELLARDEWSGLRSLPEILAAFVMPNHPTIEQILRSAARIMEGWTGDPSLSGYQSKDPKRIVTTAAAVYSAIQEIGVSYINPPASFEAEGQRIRLPDRIVDSKLATCLDIAVLSAACLEQSGLNTLVVFVKGHAVTGVWLRDESFEEPANEDFLRLRKRVDLNEIIVFDASCITNRPAVVFDRAVLEAKRHLEEPNDFLCAIDISRARKGKIRPLPERVERGQDDEEQGDISSESMQHKHSAPDLSSFESLSDPEVEKTEISPETPESRLDRWRRKLLDLSLRNRLLNFRETKKSIPLLCPDLPALEDELADGVVFNIHHKPSDFGDADPRDPDAHRRRTGDEALASFLKEELSAKRVHTDLTPEELDQRLIQTYRAARLSLEEGGASSLCLAIGFLSWYESPASEKRRLAPILMLPLEIHRKSVREGFTMKLSDDDPYINATLLEMLSHDHDIQIPGLDPIPEDDHGVDVPKILRIFRTAMLKIDRWDVLDIARIGLFSFTKYLMWSDLKDRAEDLVRNPIVDHLVNRPDEAFDEDSTFPDPERLDDERSLSRTFCPLSADSSQLSAVIAAAEGRSFVLEGPPGTGKSQTITNLIAHCLMEGKSVLFVSEKMAALNVVYSRLEKVGLGQFCLELHSNKTQKRRVIAQLEDALQRVEAIPREEWEREVRRLEGLRSELNAYARALHKNRTTGETVFKATSMLIGLRDVQRLDLGWSSPDLLSADQLTELRDLVNRLLTASIACGEVQGHAWEAVQRGDWTPKWNEEVQKALSNLDVLLKNVSELVVEVVKYLSLRSGGWSMRELSLLGELASFLLKSPRLPMSIIVRPDWEVIQTQVGNWVHLGHRRDILRSDVYRKYSDGILDLDLDDLDAQFVRAERSIWPFSWLRRRRVCNALKQVSKGMIAPDKSELQSILDRSRELKSLERTLSAVGSEAIALLGCYWKEGEADWSAIENVIKWVGELRSLSIRASGENHEKSALLREKLAHLITDESDLLSRDGKVGRQLVMFLEAVNEFLRAKSVVNDLLDLDEDLAWGRPDDVAALGRACDTLRVWQERIPDLRQWCAWRRARGDAFCKDLGPLVEAYEHGSFQGGDLRDVFERSFYQWWLNAVTESEPILSQFSSPEHERKVEQFRELDDIYTRLTRDLIASQLAQSVPATGTSVVPSSETGILTREIGKKRRHMSVRRLFNRIPNLLPRIKPCLLMSPISVAQYLDARYPPFDIVVFDEASQIPVWDAVGAIARGKQAVIVGDPKQLPPTSFFQRAEAEDEWESGDEDVVEDLESILDDCIGARIPWLSLKWHYRSRHESLIAFSNYHYYNNRLLTFPSPFREGMGVSWRHVPGGVYDKGKSRTNRIEADAVVSEIVQRLKDPNLAKLTIGVVTFNQAQQTLIEDLLEVERRKHPDVDAFFGEDVEEPLFVKNLESVQGDERDVILFSICYGPDAQERVSMNFGPMNREGGERRLNVAITRARREVLVFSTLRSDQIDLARTRARGVQDLKAFLEYAAKGIDAISEAVQHSHDADFDSPFEKAVYEAIVAKGWKLHIQVGCSGYRIDMAAVDPEVQGRYLLGIECDGANYHRAKTARDRDKLRESVLRDLGWELHRIWSTDWWTNPDREIIKVESALERARQSRKLLDLERTSIEQKEPRDTLSTSPDPVAEYGSKESSGESVIVHAKDTFSVYEPLNVYRTEGSVQAFNMSRSNHSIQEIITNVVYKEGPVRLELVAKRVAAFWGFKRVTSKVVDRVYRLIQRGKIEVIRTSVGFFLWPAGQRPEEYEGFRAPGTDPESARSAEDLPLEEVANAALYLLKQHVSIPAGDLAREAGKLFGFKRTGTVVLSRMRSGIELLASRGAAVVEGDNVRLA